MTKHCPLCGDSPVGGWRFGLLRCHTCNLILSPALWETQINERLNEIYFEDDYEPIESFWVQLFEAWNNARMIQGMHLPSFEGLSLLEIGVGSGSLLAYAKKLGFAPLGCDLSGPVCRRVESKTGIRMHHGTPQSLPPHLKFDVVIMNHVLEHVTDPLKFLSAVRARMKPAGILNIAVPNTECWEAKLSGWISYQPYHLLYFTPKTLKAVVEKAGLDALSVWTHDSFSGWLLTVLRTMVQPFRGTSEEEKELVKSRRSALVEHSYRIVTVIAGLVTLPLRRFQALIAKGDEVVLVARNRNDA